MTNGVNSAGDSVGVLIRSDFERMFKKAFSSGREPFDLLRGLVGDTSAPSLNSDQMLPGGMRADEALFFWLGGFSSDPRFPISGPGGPSFDRDINREVLEDRNRRFEFDLGRIGPRDKTTGGFPASSNRFIEYDVDLNGDNDFNDAGEHRRINFWVYSPANSELPYVYFDTSRHDPDDYDLNAYSPGETATSPQVFAVKKLREGVSVAVDLRDIIFVNKDRFQILHAGIDDAWGDFRVFSIGDGSNFSNVMHYPTGPFIGDVADTLANFAQGNFASEQE
jgi:hypothetical protein